MSGITEVWNMSVANQKRELVPRDYLYASEIGGSDVDVFLKMMGVQPTNPPDVRAMRKFDAGNHHEGLVQNVLRRLGIVQELTKDEKRVKYQIEGCVPVSGRFDILLDGSPNDLEKIVADSEAELEAMMHDDPFKEMELRKTIAVATSYMGEELPSFNNEISEVKSVSVYVYNNIEEEDSPIDRHVFQESFYVQYNESFNSSMGRLFYISRDDLRAKEFGISPNNKAMHDSIVRKSGYYLANQRPPLEPMLVIENGRIKLNFNVMYSNYISMLYGFENSEAYREVFGKKVASYNRVLKRISEGKKMTDKNEKILEDIGKLGYDPYKLAEAL